PSIRLNPSKLDACHIEGAEAVEWADGTGFYLPQRPLYVADPLFHQGAYYVQDSSSMIVGEVFRKIAGEISLERPIRILDLCAAPGGKTTDLATSARKIFGDKFILVANEPISSRAGILKENVEKWGDPNVVVVSNDPDRFAENLPGWFDIVLTDVPCSGEGMFRKEDAALQGWSIDAVENCTNRSKRIVEKAFEALSDGGFLIYSTCTFNKSENEAVPSSLGVAASTPLFGDTRFLKTKFGYTLAPGFIDGEGQSFSAFRKDGVGKGNDSREAKGRKAVAPNYKQDFGSNGKINGYKSRLDINPKDLQTYFSAEMVFKTKGEFIKAVPAVIANEIATIENALSVLSSGILAFEIKGRDLIPQQDLAWSTALGSEAF
ncbi:MAG: RsmB/NOP family class I SAM-dependent RNA methyltransferase, partial [Bacteroidales bacterium]|nr:RsmB/NOP family class I SAM-dependent RNA methyltransferase [Bacteroidales bacterium]